MTGAASILGKQADSVFIFVLVVCLALLFLITSLMLYFAFRYSRTRNPAASDIEGSTLLEAFWTIVPVFIVMTMFYYGSIVYTERRNIPEGAIAVNATGRQWSWTFGYENGKEETALKVPVGKPVVINLSSEDVIHSLFIPAFRVKEDVVPGMGKRLWFTADEQGTYDLFCTEYCGLGHSMMITKVEVMKEEDFNGWHGLPRAEKAPMAETAPPEKPAPAPVALAAKAEKGRELIKTRGCTACHSTDGTRIIGPTFKGVFMRKEKVITGGKERGITVDEEYMIRSMLEPNIDLVSGFPPVMPPQKGILKDEEIEAIVEYLKTLK